MKGEAPRRDERWLAGVWASQAFDKRRLRTTSGLTFKVVFAGLCTGGPGPDFRDAILALADGSLLRGDVEIHLESSGWRQHGHDRDPAYDGVLLHVVLEDDQPARTSRGEPVLTLELAGRLRLKSLPAAEPPAPRPLLAVRESSPALRLAPAPVAVLEQPETPARPEETSSGPLAVQTSYVVAPCRGVLPRQEPKAVAGLLRRLALERFAAKQAVFEGELAVFEPEQVLYAGLLEALGYSRNRAPFRRLAQLAPLDALRCARTAAAIEQLLLEAAGLAPASGALENAGRTGETLTPSDWQTAGVRPDNLPAKRIAQFAAMLARLLPLGLLDALLAPLLEGTPSPGSRSAQDRSGHSQSAQDLCAQHFGPQRAAAMAINVVLPFAAAYGQATCQFLLSEAAVEAFLAQPAEGSNQVTRYMRRDILGAHAGATVGAAGEQGLLHAWDQWCHHKVCALCPLASAQRIAAR